MQNFSIVLRQFLETRLHQAKAINLIGRRLLVLFEKLKKGRAFPCIETPTFLDDESRNAETKVIDVGHFRPFSDPSARTIQRLISRSRCIRDAASSKITL